MQPARYAFIMGLCSFCILLSVTDFILPLFIENQLTAISCGNSQYLLRDQGGMVAVTDLHHPDIPPQMLDICVNLLPETQALRVKAGWPVSDAEHLRMLLEELANQQVFTLRQKRFSAINREGK